MFVGHGEDPHYRPPGWDRGRKVGWAKHGDPSLPPGLSRKVPQPVVVVVEKDDNGKGNKNRNRNRNRRGRGHD
jgi:hypothetical protein